MQVSGAASSIGLPGLLFTRHGNLVVDLNGLDMFSELCYSNMVGGSFKVSDISTFLLKR